MNLGNNFLVMIILLCCGCTAMDNINSVINPAPTVNNVRSYQADADTVFKAIVLTVKDYHWTAEQIDETQKIVKIKQVEDKTFSLVGQWTSKNAYNDEAPDCREGRFDISINVIAKDNTHTDVAFNFKPSASKCNIADSVPLTTYWMPIYSNGSLEDEFLQKVNLNIILVR